MPTFSEQIWEEVAPLRQAIIDLPFNQALMDGSLSRDRFQYYMLQDSLYLESYARALAIAAAKAPEPDMIIEFSEAAKTAIVVERALHAGFFQQFGLSDAEIAAARQSPTCANYCNYLLMMAHNASHEEAVAAILPCFWVYREVGLHLAKHAKKNDHPYQAWIDTYSDKDFSDATDRVIAITDKLAAQVAPEHRKRMGQAFTRCTQYEWMFWDAAWRLEDWPI